MEKAILIVSKLAIVQIPSSTLNLSVGPRSTVTPEIFSPNDKKSFCSIEGERNGVMYAKYSTGGNIVFIDNKKLPIMKEVRKLEDQNEYESRCLWKDVIFNLNQRH